MDKPAQATPDLGTLFRLDGKKALIVGGYGGIGQVTSEVFTKYGAAIAIAGRAQDKAQALAAKLSAGGARAIGARVDISDRTSAFDLVAHTVKELGGLDILVSLAGIDI